MADRFNLQRFVEAQRALYGTVTAQLQAGRKRSHWMWFIFPQIAGLGRSEMARRFAISGLAEARAYLGHALMGERLRECSRLVAAIEGRSIAEIFGAPDDLKFHSSMTLFAEAAPDEPLFGACLQKYFQGRRDAATLSRLQAGAADR
ncbi:MAG TPA: DUF1810 domain-containing protein [Janthinobacterium sp.]|nr:DUF1810 domain-containing protein [Janthinobacterium sp.]